MHRALTLVSEVLQEIFANLNQIPSYTDGRSSSRRSLTALARTCKTFYEPAMDLLWSDMDGLEPLLGCVTRLHPMIYGDTKYSWSQGVEPLSELEACQFLRHATRVRSLCISTPEHFHLLTVLSIETCAFPRLLSLSWPNRHMKTSHLLLFLSPTLRYCSLSLFHSDLRSIGTRCPALEDLSIVSAKHTADQLSLLSEIIRSCKRLVRLRCPRLDSAAWNHLSDMPTLLRVTILDRVRVHSPLDWGHLNFASFLNVTSLVFFVDTAADIITVMQHSQFPSLKRFMMHANFLSSGEAEQLGRALSECKACQTLEHIDIVSPLGQDSRNSLTAIRQFLGFIQLRSLRLSAHYSIYLDSDLLEAMSSWPHIVVLELAHSHCRPPTVTLRGLFTALRLCPHLHTLRVSIDAVNIDIDPKAESFQHTFLQILDVGYSHAEDAEAIACIISSMLPCVHRVSYELNTGSHLVWEEVNRRLELFAALDFRITEVQDLLMFGTCPGVALE